MIEGTIKGFFEGIIECARILDEEIEDVEGRSALVEVQNKLRAPKAQSFIRLTLEEARALKSCLEETIRGLRFEADEMIQESLKEEERFLIKLNALIRACAST